jgi:type IV secretion system protein VirB8
MSKTTDSDTQSLKEYIESGEYYKDARRWYDATYLKAFSERTYLFFICIYIFILLCTLLLNFRVLLPLKVDMQYALYSSNYRDEITISKANQIPNNPLLSIADIMLRKYVIHREEYSYFNLNKQFAYVQNNSTISVFNQFNNYMSINNPISPILRYQQHVKREIKILSTSFPSNNNAIVRFNSLAKVGAEVFEDMLWEADISFNADKIDTNLEEGQKFNFVVTEYKLSVIENKLKK